MLLTSGEGGDVPDRHLLSTMMTDQREDPVVYNYKGELERLTTPVPRSGSSLGASRQRVRPSLLSEDPSPIAPPVSLGVPRRPSEKCNSSPSPVPPLAVNTTASTRVAKVGLPLPQPDVINPSTGKRDVHMGPDMPLQVTPEEKTRFVEVEFFNASQLVRGTILGTAENGDTIWHERGKRFAQRLQSQDVKSMISITPARCKHCGVILARDEAEDHVASHKKGGGVEHGTAVGDEFLGTACGDTALLLRMVRVKQLGAGAQGEVWLCRDSEVPTEVIKANAKSLKPQGLYVQKDMKCTSEKDAVQKYQQSVRLMNLNHVHVINYLAVQRHPKDSHVTVLMPYYNEGDVAGLIRSQRQPFSEHYICSLLLQIATALNFLHSRIPVVIHGDIKPENVLLFNRKEQIVLMDLDASKELATYAKTTTTNVGTTAWMAPESLHQQQSSPKSDIWSTGLVAYVLCVLPDFPMIHCDASDSTELINSTSWSMDELLRKVGGKVVSRGYSQQLAALIARMLHREDRRRPSAADLLEQLTTIMTSQLVVSQPQ